MSKITLQNIYECYEYGKKIAENNFDIGTAVKIIAKNGMDIGSSRIYIRCVISMISGVRYTGTVNEMAVTHFLTSILTDYGFAGLQKALNSLRLHLDYQKEYQTLPGMERIYAYYYDILP